MKMPKLIKIGSVVLEIMEFYYRWFSAKPLTNSIRIWRHFEYENPMFFLDLLKKNSKKSSKKRLQKLHKNFPQLTITRSQRLLNHICKNFNRSQNNS